MILPRIIPCLLLCKQGLYKTFQFKDPKYIGDPINTVKIFNEKAVDEIILLDINATKAQNEPQYNFIEQIASEAFMPMAYGGGIFSVEQAQKILRLGIEKVVINTAAVKNPQLIADLAKVIGSSSVVVSIDAKKNIFGNYKVYINSGTEATKYEPAEYAKMMQNLGAGELFVNSIVMEGTMNGYDIDLIHQVSSAVNIPVIASGGAGKIYDFHYALKNGGASAVAAGSMFVFHGKHRAVLINYPANNELVDII